MTYWIAGGHSDNDRKSQNSQLATGPATRCPRRATGISGTPVAEQDWTLDPTGNWNGFVVKASGSTTLDQSRTQNKVNEITAITASDGTDWADPVYDAAGNMTTMPKPSSLANSYTATYDAWNRMIQVKDGGTTITTYGYDGRNRRITVDTGVVRHFYFTNSWQDVEQRLGSLTTADQQYVWGIRYIDDLSAAIAWPAAAAVLRLVLRAAAGSMNAFMPPRTPTSMSPACSTLPPTSLNDTPMTLMARQPSGTRVGPISEPPLKPAPSSMRDISMTPKRDYIA
jgi:YD repeat-containing protein